MQDNVTKIAQLLDNTSNSDLNIRKNGKYLICRSFSKKHKRHWPHTTAEIQLASAQKVPGFAVVMTDLIFNQNISPSTRLAASIMLKNFVKSKWDTDQIADNDRQHIKKTALNLMLASPSNIQAQLCDMISIICENDPYQKWLDLLVVSISFSFINYHW